MHKKGAQTSKIVRKWKAKFLLRSGAKTFVMKSIKYRFKFSDISYESWPPFIRGHLLVAKPPDMLEKHKSLQSNSCKNVKTTYSKSYNFLSKRQKQSLILPHPLKIPPTPIPDLLLQNLTNDHLFSAGLLWILLSLTRVWVGGQMLIYSYSQQQWNY